MIFRLPHRWSGELDYGWGRSRTAQYNVRYALDTAGSAAVNTGLPSGDGRPALNVLQEGNTYPVDYSPYLMPIPNYGLGPFDTIHTDATLRLSGPVMELPGGAANLSVLVARRGENVESGFIHSYSNTTLAPTFRWYPPRKQDTDSYALELRAPLISSRNAMPWAQALDLQVSIRRDEYTMWTYQGSTLPVPSKEGPFPDLDYFEAGLKSTDYSLGLRYLPLEDVMLRASIGTGILPPNLQQIAPGASYPYNFAYGILDPKRGNTDFYVGNVYQVAFGGSPDLTPEESKSLSAGVVFTPRNLPGLRMSVDYSKIDKTNEIQIPTFEFVIESEDLLPGRLERGPNLPGDPAGWAGRDRLNGVGWRMWKSLRRSRTCWIPYRRCRLWGPISLWDLAPTATRACAATRSRSPRPSKTAWPCQR